MLRRTETIKVISARRQLKGQKVSINEELNKNTIKLNKLGHTIEICRDALKVTYSEYQIMNPTLFKIQLVHSACRWPYYILFVVCFCVGFFVCVFFFIYTWYLEIHLTVQLVPISIKDVCSNPVDGELCDTTLCDKVCQWLPTGLSSINKNWPPRQNWNIAQSGAKHQ